jgi:16S rRNA (uracil1498-N3)-methyltransferase
VADPRWADWNKGVFHCAEGSKISALNWTLQTPYRAVVAIGPEGDFTTEEVALAERSGWTPLSLGAARLRTETAAVAAAALLLQRWETPLVVDGNAL